ncbi:MAG: hypothetical protein XD49_1668 [Caldanaerobacter subterraneus]|uniref:Uncharacterized protein n=1 Tax=Caldanaerobacter subterraneus TaxID=911092 RepID=A0A117KVJ2_9THEO|nr:hypothetical protein [Caldanaerobacter subterraneus]KUK08290.1 MAG: hypothetical protein XD49_1668 [Caldanaerobacter subterraneus]HBT48488.1 hypothetical protein [Caldanaerobacter subterraneus]
MRSDILDLIKNYRTISIIGMAKNVGKTTVLNYLISKARGIYTLGLTSIGRDGEEYDQVSFFPKPRIYVEESTLIATAKEALFRSDITKEIVGTTGIYTPMGEIIVARALSDGYVDLAGPSITKDLKRISEFLISIGADKVFIDGALNRKTQASPAVSEATILSTGAVLSPDMEKTIDETVFTVKLLTVQKESDREIIVKASKILENSNLGFIYEGGEYKTVEVLTAIDASKEIVENLNGAKYVVIRGVITDKLISDVMTFTDKYKGVVFLAEDATKLFIEEETFVKFQKAGGIFRVVFPINLICVTVNPISPTGYRYNGKEFLNRLREKLDLPVFDVMGGD